MISINNAVLRADINKLKEKSMRVRKAFGDRDTLTHVAEQGIRIIADRTANKHIDANGTKFADYTDEYKITREKGKMVNGRRSGGPRSLIPDLVWTGQMMDDMHSLFLSWGKAAIIFITKESADKAVGNMKKRKFFDIRMDNEKAKLIRAAEGKVDDIIKREGLA